MINFGVSLLNFLWKNLEFLPSFVFMSLASWRKKWGIYNPILLNYTVTQFLFLFHNLSHTSFVFHGLFLINWIFCINSFSGFTCRFFFLIFSLILGKRIVHKKIQYSPLISFVFRLGPCLLISICLFEIIYTKKLFSISSPMDLR